MVIVLSGRECRQETEISAILLSHGTGCLPILSLRRPECLFWKNCVIIVPDRSGLFLHQRFPSGAIGICEGDNPAALELFRRNDIPVITCGMNGKCTMTVSSCERRPALVTLRRRICDLNGMTVDPGEFSVDYPDCMLFSLMASAAALLLHGVSPEE